MRFEISDLFLFKMIKAIIFDGGGVIVNHNPLMNKFIKIFKPKNKKKFLHDINIEAIPLCKNKISENEFWIKIADIYGTSPKKIPKNLWTRDFDKLTKIDKKVVRIIKKLSNNYKLGFISNAIKSHEKINRKRGLFDLFDIVVLSHKIRMTKDDKRIFSMTAKKLKINPKECIFIDDVKDFVDVAKSVGMKGILFKNIGQLKSDLDKILN